MKSKKKWDKSNYQDGVSFPNGLDNYLKTYLEITFHLFGSYDVTGTMAQVTYAGHGNNGLYELARILSNDFENSFKGLHQGTEYFTKLSQFLDRRETSFMKAREK